MKKTPILRKTPLKRGGFIQRKTGPKPGGFIKRTKFIPRVSPRLAAQLEIYRPAAKAFMARPENKWCPVAAIVLQRKVMSNQVHHIKGRLGPLLLDETWWMGVSDFGHWYIHRGEPNDARARGWRE